MNAYVSAIATAAVVSDRARFPLSTIWNVSKYENFSSMYFPIFGQNTDIFGVNIRIKFEYGKYGIEKTQYPDSFHALSFTVP